MIDEVVFDAASNMTTITGTLRSQPGSSYQIQIYRSPTADPSGFGEGRDAIGTAFASIDDTGIGTFSIQVQVPGSVAGQFFTATALNQSTGDTSEFSKAVVGSDATPPAAPSVATS